MGTLLVERRRVVFGIFTEGVNHLLNGFEVVLEVVAHDSFHVFVCLVIEHGNDHHVPKEVGFHLMATHDVGNRPGEGDIFKVFVFSHFRSGENVESDALELRKEHVSFNERCAELPFWSVGE